jgi:CBS domain-containing protein
MSDKTQKLVKEFITEKITIISEESPIDEILEKIVEDRETTIACVVDDENKLKGIITPKKLLKGAQIRKYKSYRYPVSWGEIYGLIKSKNARDIMRAKVSVKPDDNIIDAITLMLENGFYEVPVVDDDEKVIGEINYFRILMDWIEYIRKER